MKLWTDDHQAHASMEGWDIFYTTGAPGHAEYEIQALAEPPEGATDLCDDRGEPQDCVAWRIVTTKAAQGSELHISALAFLAVNAVEELIGIVNFLIGGTYNAPVKG